ncbi:MAG: hypothetical protein ACRDRJ_44610 [Streptosporangiaceae bacterium]
MSAAWPPDLGGYEATISRALRDAIRFQREHRDGEDWPGQVGLYKVAARALGLDPGDPGPAPGPVLDPEGRQLSGSDVATLIGALNHAIDLMNERAGPWCETCIEALDGTCDDHAGASARALAYRALAERLGGA